MNKKTALMLLGCAVALPALSHAAVYDLATNSTVNFDSAVDTLTNTTFITDWTDSTLDFSDGSNLSGVDFTTLGLTSWTTGKFGSSAVTNWDGANLSGIALTATGNNFGYNDSMVGLNFSGGSFSHGGGNQPFLFVDATDANFSGTIFNITATGNNAFRDNGSTASLRNADFSNITWGLAMSAAQAGMFGAGAGAVDAADAANAASFAGANLSNITGAAKANVIANLGAFDGLTAIGAKYDAAMLANSTGWTAVELDAAGWQAIPEPGTYALLAGLSGLAFVMLRRRRA